MCVHYGCTTFSCWNAFGRQVCKINPSNDGTAACAVSGLTRGLPAPAAHALRCCRAATQVACSKRLFAPLSFPALQGCASDITFRCPAGMCCNVGQCESPTDPKYNGASVCGASQSCCAVSLGCQKSTPTWLYGARAQRRCGRPRGMRLLGVWPRPSLPPCAHWRHAPTPPSAQREPACQPTSARAWCRRTARPTPLVRQLPPNSWRAVPLRSCLSAPAPATFTAIDCCSPPLPCRPVLHAHKLHNVSSGQRVWGAGHARRCGNADPCRFRPPSPQLRNV